MVSKINLRSTLLATALTFTVATTLPVHALASPENVTESASAFYGSDVYNKYDKQVNIDSIKYGFVESRNKTNDSNEMNFTYYTHYSLNQAIRLKNAQFNFTIDQELLPYVETVKVKTGKNKWVTANQLKDNTYSIYHKDVLKTGLIGVNQQFDFKVVLKDTINHLDKDLYAFDIALLNKNKAAVKSTMNTALFDRNANYKGIVESNTVTASGLTVQSQDPLKNEIILDYMMHYKLNNLTNKNGLFKFNIDKKLMPYVKDIQVQTTDGKFKSVKYNNQGEFSYAAKSLVSYASIGVRQNYAVKIVLNDITGNLPQGLYQFNIYQTDGDGTLSLENTNNSAYFTR